jgi:hypothetical protein
MTKEKTSTRTYSYNIAITIVQALVIPMKVPRGVDIYRPPLGCFGNYRPREFGERMKRRDAICESET